MVPPSGLKVVHITKDSAKVKWTLLPVVQSCGVITGYAIKIFEYTPTRPLNSTYMVNNQERKFSFQNLMPSSKYSVQVAAVTSAGTGVFSHPVIFLTKGSKRFQP